jgi:hypothetical protein
MGSRFRKRIKIAKGLHLTVNKSGFGLSMGSYGRKKSKRSSHYGYSNRNYAPQKVETTFDIHIEFDDETGQEKLYATNMQTGQIVRDMDTIRKLMRLPDVKDQFAQMRQRAYERQMEKNDQLIEIYKHAQPLITLAEVERNISQLQPIVHEVQSYPEPMPTEAMLRARLFEMAKVQISDWKFWSLDRRRHEYVAYYLPGFSATEIANWQQRKALFDQQETQRVTDENERAQAEYEEEMADYQKLLACDEEYIEDAIEDVLESIQLPVEFSIDFEVVGRMIRIDLDLPEIEDYPKRKPVISASGKFSFKDKPVKVWKEEYARSVVGMAFYFASVMFNLSPSVEEVSISAYTQRLNKKTGHTENQYVYDVQFAREIFAKLRVAQIDPIEAIANFPHKISISAGNELKTIELS